MSMNCVKPTIIEDKSYAKLNLFLHVTGKTLNNYHTIDSLVVFCENIYDTIRIHPSEKFALTISGNFAPSLEGENIIIKTISLLSDYLTDKNFNVHLTKNTPIGSGMGGGSSNAATLIKMLQKTNKLIITDNQLSNVLVKIGADVPICYYGKAAYLNGIGEIISPILKFPRLYAVVLFPGLNISTQKIYSLGFQKYHKNISKKIFFHDTDELFSLLSNTKNDLQEKTITLKPEMLSYITELKSQKGCILSKMTGSGSAIFGLFKVKNEAINATKELQDKLKFFCQYTGLF